MSKHALVGKYGPNQKDGKKRRKDAAPLMPLDYALTRMRDESLDPETRDAMAKAALPFTHGRHPLALPPAPRVDEEVAQWSDLELARRIQHILFLADREQEEKGKAAEAGTPPRSDVAPGPVATIAPDWPAPATMRCEPQDSAQVLPDQVLPDDEAYVDDPFDPHRGYRWIP